jgi:signal transduction histidine kinase
MKGGETCSRVLEINTFPVFNDAGDVQLVVEVARDVTEEKEDQALASHYEKMAALGLLAAGIAHDLGNPLASLSSELQMLKQEECDIERMRKSLETLERHIARITDSLRDILGFAGKRTDRSGRASVQSAIDDALRLLRYDPRARSVRFEVDVLHNVPHITMRENDLILVLLNVMVNAIDAMPTGGHVRVYIRDVDLEHIVLAIEDTGTGMDADTLERATQPLFTTKAETGGTGLGLAVASTLMDRVGGALAIRSAPGKGSTVTLRLPLRRPPECQDDAA